MAGRAPLFSVRIKNADIGPDGANAPERLSLDDETLHVYQSYQWPDLQRVDRGARRCRSINRCTESPRCDAAWRSGRLGSGPPSVSGFVEPMNANFPTEHSRFRVPLWLRALLSFLAL